MSPLIKLAVFSKRASSSPGFTSKPKLGSTCSGIPFTLDEFYDLNNCILIQSDTRNISLQLVLNYNINGQTFCIIKTGLLIKFQKLWRKYYKQKINFYKNPKNIFIRQYNLFLVKNLIFTRLKK